jgi:DNA mismatch repair protein MutS2
LLQTSEYVSSFQNNNAIPNHGFDAISHEIKFLIEDSFLEVGSFRKIATLSSTVNFLLTYFKKFDDYPHLNSRASQVELTKDIISPLML